jgi:phosphomannomutase
LASQNSDFIKEDFNGYDIYVDYLKKSVAKPVNIEMIKKAGADGFKIMCDTVGGCMYRSMVPILEKLGIADVFEWRNKEEDPFFHGIGKTWKINAKTNEKEFFDNSCDFCLFDVVKTANFEEDLKDKPIGYIVLITDPDGDRLNIGQIESKEKTKILDELGVDYISIDENKVFVVYNPTFGFFLIMDFYMKQLKQEGIWEDHPRYIVVTTPCSKCWNERAETNGIKIVMTPVGMKEIATVIKKTEKQILENPDKDVILEDIFGQKINLGKDPRMVFG